MYEYRIEWSKLFEDLEKSINKEFKFVYTDKSNEKLTIKILVPGADKDDVDIELVNNLMTIKYENQAYNINISYGIGTSDYNTETMQTSLKNGVLTIIMDKKEELKARKITLT